MTTPLHHLPDEWLLDRAAGGLDEAGSVFVAAHLALCPACRARTRVLEEFGGRLIDAQDASVLSGISVASVFAEIDRRGGASGGGTGTGGADPIETALRPLRLAVGTPGAAVTRGFLTGLPAPVARLMPCGASEAWRPAGSGLRTLPLPLPAGRRCRDGRLRLVRGACGASFPAAAASGPVLVLDGRISGGGRSFRRGDVTGIDGPPSDRPADGACRIDEACLCLTLSRAAETEEGVPA